MLKQRILTALILAPLAIWGVLALSSPVFAIVVGLVFVLGAREWGRFAGFATVGQWGYALILGALLVLLYPFISSHDAVAIALISLALLWWFLGLVWVLKYPAGSALWARNRLLPALAGVLILIPAWMALVWLQRIPGPEFVLLLMLLVWGADVGAFFAGRRWGRRKLAPQVSPGKTWAGFYGALASALVIAVVAILLPRPVIQNIPGFLLLSLLTVSISVLGDLMESMFKRMAGLKDSGHLLPGHGGVLDRIDSMTAAAPLFAAGLMCMGVGS